MTRVERYLPLLKAVTRIKNKVCRRQILRQLSKDSEFSKCMKEIAENLLRNNVPLSTKDKRRLNREARVIRALRREKGISQSGGFLNIVVPLLASLVGELIASKVAK